MDDLNPLKHGSSEESGCLTALVRLVWMGLGNLFLFIVTILIIKQQFPIIADFLFWVIVVGMIWVRYIDITRFNGTTSEGQPATLQHWQRYSIKLVAIYSVLFIFARVLAHYRILSD